MDSKIVYCTKHKLSVAQCNCKEMHYKQPYKVPKSLEEITDEELRAAWWWAFRRLEDYEIECNPKDLRRYLAMLLNG